MILTLTMVTVMKFLILIELQIYTSDVDAKSRISSLNEFSKINLKEIRGAVVHDDGVFIECKLSDQEFDDEDDDGDD